MSKNCLIAWLFWASAAYADMALVAEVPALPAQALNLPPGFGVQVFARVTKTEGENFSGARFMAFGPDGTLYLSTGMQNEILMLPDDNHDGRADRVVVLDNQLNAPQGMVFVGDDLYVANQDSVVKLIGVGSQRRVMQKQTLIHNLPGGGHALKTLRQGPDGFLYLNVGSSCNLCIETDPIRATLLRYSVEGRPAGALPAAGLHPASAIWATGLRNTQGFAWHPATGAMYAVNAGADSRSDRKNGSVRDDLPPEHLNLIQPGRQYGWPYCWGNRVSDPNFAGPEGFCAQMTPPVATFPAHSTPIGITFLARAAVPSAMRQDALVALHGSWNTEVPVGYKVVRVLFQGDRVVSVSDFMTGWLNEGAAWGRPVDVAVGLDGAIYVSDDRAGIVYRVSYRKTPGK